MNTYLVKYRPLIGSQPGQDAIKQYNLPPYIDNSCRREPDFQAAYPSISSVCRGKIFAPRLKVGDIVVYITVLGKYPGLRQEHWRFVAVIEVCEQFGSHAEAALWYQSKQLALPSNCLVPNNPPVPRNQTSGRGSCKPKQEKRTQNCAGKKLLDNDVASLQWDKGYQERTKQWGTFSICKPLYPIALYNPPPITRENMREIFAKPLPRNPVAISSQQFDKLKLVANS
jgi:hypothetical protein